MPYESLGVSRIAFFVEERELQAHKIQSSLEKLGFAVRRTTGEALLGNGPPNEVPDLLILGRWTGPGIGRVELVNSLRASPRYQSVPVLALVSQPKDLEGFAIHFRDSFDYVFEPFTVKEMAARTTHLLNKRLGGVRYQLTHKGLRVDLMEGKTFLENEDLALTQSEFRILLELIQQRGQIVSREYLCQRVLRPGRSSGRTIDVHMNSIRKKISRISNEFGSNILTVQGQGYSII